MIGSRINTLDFVIAIIVLRVLARRRLPRLARVTTRTKLEVGPVVIKGNKKHLPAVNVTMIAICPVHIHPDTTRQEDKQQEQSRYVELVLLHQVQI